MKEHFEYSERLYRKVIKKPDFWKKESGKPSSAVFKDSKGVSVDRDGGRGEREIISTFHSRFGKEHMKAIVSITAGFCKDIGTHLKYTPTEDNCYHSEIHRSPEKVTLTNAQARKIAKNCEVVYLNDA